MLNFYNLSHFFFNTKDIIKKNNYLKNNNFLINHLNYNGEKLYQNDKQLGGIILDKGYYGKCIHPDTYINVNYKTQKIKDLYKEYENEKCEFDGLGYWYHLNNNLLIESFNEFNKSKCFRKIDKIYKQFIKEKIKIITLDNHYLIKITHNHKLKISLDKKDIWTNNFEVGQLVYIFDYNNNILSINKISNIKEEYYEGFVYDLSIKDTKNYFANGILCHNTSHYTLNSKINFDKALNNNISILCPSWRIEFWLNHLNKGNFNIIKVSCKNDLRIFFSNSKKTPFKSSNSKKKIYNIYILSLNIFENEDYRKKIDKFINKYTFEQLIIDYDFKEYKKDKKNVLINSIKNIKYRKYWLLINTYDEFFDDLETFKNILNLYFLNNKTINYSTSNTNSLDKNLYNLCDISKIIIYNEYLIFNKKNKIKLLNFNETERKNYDIYINKFKDIYESNSISFDNDDYLKKYCCYAQNKLKINYFSFQNLNLSHTSLNKLDIDNLGTYKNKFIENVSNIINGSNKKCDICLSDIRKENLGITNCGHIFCFSCIYKSVSYNCKCPDCRKDIKKDEIYLYDNIPKTNEDETKYFKEKYCSLLEELGTKISYLVNFIKENERKKIFIFSNYKENINNISEILNQLKIKNYILDSKSKKIDLSRKVLLSTYDYNYYKLDNKILDYDIIFNEPYYSCCKNNIVNKYSSILNTFNKNKTHHLIIKDSIEENNFNKNKNLLEKLNFNIFN